jgi:ATP-dependent Lon protease
MRDYRDAKAMAQALRQALKERSVSLTHSESLELIARLLGVADWNVLSARIQAATSPSTQAVPAIRLPVLPLRDLVLFPQMMTPIFAARVKSARAIERALTADKRLFFVTQLRAADDDPEPSDLYQVGVIASVMQAQRLEDGSFRLMVQGLRRAGTLRFEGDGACLVADVAPIQEEGMAGEDAATLSSEVLRHFEAHANVSLSSPPQALIYLSQQREPGRIADMLAQHLSISIAQRQEVLQTVNVVHRLRTILAMMQGDRQAA